MDDDRIKAAVRNGWYYHTGLYGENRRALERYFGASSVWQMLALADAMDATRLEELSAELEKVTAYRRRPAGDSGSSND